MRLLWKESRKQKVLDFKVVKLENKFLKKNQQIKTILSIVWGYAIPPMFFSIQQAKANWL